MANVIKLRKGLDINLTGKASKDVAIPVVQAAEYALVPKPLRELHLRWWCAKATMSTPETPCLSTRLAQR